MEYKYSLDSSSKKFNCPGCNKKRFVRYFNNKNKTYCNSNVGRCDREQVCGYHLKPEFNKDVEFTSNFKNTVNTIVTTSTLPFSLITQTLGLQHSNNLVDFLFNHFDEAKTKGILTDYKVGTSKKWKGATLFWQIDINNNVRSGKIIDYDSFNGKRIKDPYPRVSWVNKSLEKLNKLPNNYKLKQCLFGEHLLSNPSYSNKIVAIVESEKTALIMAINYSDYLWLSCGSLNGIKTNLLNPIKNKRVVLFPDKGCFDKWNEQTTQLNKQGYNIKVSPLIEDLNIEKGLDLADLFDNSKVAELNINTSNTNISKKCNTIVAKNSNTNIAKEKTIYDTNGMPVKLTPELKYLIEKLGLENE